MRTEHDLREAIQAIADRAPSVQEADLVIPGDDGPRRPVRRLQLAAAIAATVAAVAVPVLLLTSGPAPAPAGGKAILRDTFDVRADGWREYTRAMYPTHQVVMVDNGRDDHCFVIVYEPGGFDADRIPRGSARLTVGGNPGYYAQLVGPLTQDPLEDFGAGPSPSTGPDAPRRQVVIWRYADDAWAASSCERLRDQQPLRREAELVANGTVFTSEPVRLPVKIGYLPDGLQPVSGVTNSPRTDPGKTPEGELLRLDLLPAGSRSAPVNHLTIRYATGFPLDTSGGVEKLTINGRQATLNGADLQLAVGPRAVISIDGGDDETRAELIRIAQSLEFAPDPADTSTWFDSDDALP